MKKYLGLSLVLIVASVLFLSCGKNSPTAPNLAPEQGKMAFSLAIPVMPNANIASGRVTITKGVLVLVKPITITNNTGSVSFDSIQVGTWAIAVQLFDAAGVEIYTGTGSALVSPNATTTIRIQVVANTGTLVIIVEVPGPTPTATATPTPIVWDFENQDVSDWWGKVTQRTPIGGDFDQVMALTSQYQLAGSYGAWAPKFDTRDNLFYFDNFTQLFEVYHKHPQNIPLHHPQQFSALVKCGGLSYSSYSVRAFIDITVNGVPSRIYGPTMGGHYGERFIVSVEIPPSQVDSAQLAGMGVECNFGEIGGYFADEVIIDNITYVGR
jgi:hypothetical protein